MYPLFRAASRPWTQALADSSWFQTSVTLTIVAAGITVGIDVENAAEPHPYSDRFLNVFLWYADVVINWIFTVEVLVKLLGEDWHPWTYFYDNWNKFDFVIVFCSWLPLLLALLGDGGGGGLGALKLLRLLRLFRIMRVIKFLPELKVIIEALMVGMESIGFIALIMFVVFYLFAVAELLFICGAGELDDAFVEHKQSAYASKADFVALPAAVESVLPHYKGKTKWACAHCALDAVHLVAMGTAVIAVGMLV